MNIEPVLSLFLARLIAGYCVCLALLGPRVTAGSWPRVSLFVIAGLCTVGIPAGISWPACAAAGGLALGIERARTFSVPVLRSTLWMLPAGLWVWAAREWPPTFSGIAGGVAAGGALATMLLGHSYLTARGLTFRPMKIMANVLFYLLILRTVQVGIAMLMADRLAAGDWIFLSARIAFGLFLPLVFGWMVIQCVKIESNQSATGILYAMTALLGAGELIAAFLTETNGLAV